MIKNILKNKACLLLTGLFLFLLGTDSLHAQANIVDEFEIRQPINPVDPRYRDATNRFYSLKGDFKLIGNTNLTLVDYGVETMNSNNLMKYVDVDGDPNTINSSSADIEFDNPDCSQIIYAGLYWSGRANTVGNQVTTYSQHQLAPVSEPESSIGQYGVFKHSFYNLAIGMQGTNNNYRVRYEMIGAGLPTYQFEFYNDSGGFNPVNNSNRIRYRIGTSGTWTDLPSTRATSGSTWTATLNTPFVINDGGLSISITKFQRPTTTNGSQSTYENGSFVLYTESGTGKAEVTLNKNQVKLKFGNESYVQVTADEFQGPNNTDEIYVGYADVTSYVADANRGAGKYTIADLALSEGNGASVGYFGSWGLVIVYADSNGRNRDIFVYDGYAYIKAITTGTDEHEDLKIQGFTAVQKGDVNVTLGLMAGEGDRGIAGDYFSMKYNTNSNFLKLSHSGNLTNNFFYSSVNTGGNARDLSLENNTGIDVVRFDLPNSSKNLITNGQTETTFRYGTTQDLYVIYSLVLAVDSFIPEAVAVNSVDTVGGTAPADPDFGITSPGVVTPGEELGMHLDLYNRGDEDILNLKVEIEIPGNLHFDATSVVIEDQHASPTYNYDWNSTNTHVTWLPPTGAPAGATPDVYPGGTLVWEANNSNLVLPHGDVNKILGRIRYNVHVIEDCFVLLSSQNGCALEGDLGGVISGIGAQSEVSFEGSRIVSKIEAADACGNFVDNTNPFKLSLDVTGIGTFCDAANIENGVAVFNVNATGNRADIVNSYLPGTKFYSDLALTQEVTGDFIASSDPNNPAIYYAVVPGFPADCPLIIDVRTGGSCTKPPLEGPGLNTKVGITSLGRAGTTQTDLNGDDWPMLRKGGFIALESQTKGFVLNRLSDAQIAAITPIEGMMVYNTTQNCIQVYIMTDSTTGGWYCMDEDKGCPDTE